MLMITKQMDMSQALKIIPQWNSKNVLISGSTVRIGSWVTPLREQPTLSVYCSLDKLVILVGKLYNKEDICKS